MREATRQFFLTVFLGCCLLSVGHCDEGSTGQSSEQAPLHQSDESTDGGDSLKDELQGLFSAMEDGFNDQELPEAVVLTVKFDETGEFKAAVNASEPVNNTNVTREFVTQLNETVKAYGDSTGAHVPGDKEKAGPPPVKARKAKTKPFGTMVPVISLFAIRQFLFGGADINAKGSYGEHYTSILVLGSMVAGGDRVSDMLNDYSIDAVKPDAQTAVIILLTADAAAALRGNPNIQTSQLNFLDATHFFAYKPAANYTGYYVVETVKEKLFSDIQDKALQAGLSKLVAAPVLATPFTLKVVTNFLYRDKKVVTENNLMWDIYFDQLFSTSISLFQSSLSNFLNYFMGSWDRVEVLDSNGKKSIQGRGISDGSSAFICMALGKAGIYLLKPLAQNSPAAAIGHAASNHLVKVGAYGFTAAANQQFITRGYSDIPRYLGLFATTLVSSYGSYRLTGISPFTNGSTVKNIQMLMNLFLVVSESYVNQWITEAWNSWDTEAYSWVYGDSVHTALHYYLGLEFLMRSTPKAKPLPTTFEEDHVLPGMVTKDSSTTARPNMGQSDSARSHQVKNRQDCLITAGGAGSRPIRGFAHSSCDLSLPSDMEPSR